MVGDSGAGHKTSHGYHGVRPVPRNDNQQQIHEEPQHERRPTKVINNRTPNGDTLPSKYCLRLPQEYCAVISRGSVLASPSESFLTQTKVFGHGQYGKRQASVQGGLVTFTHLVRAQPRETFVETNVFQRHRSVVARQSCKTPKRCVCVFKSFWTG